MTIIMSPMDDLRAEHRALMPSIDALARVAGDVGTEAPEIVRSEVGHVLDFLRLHLLPHAAAEEECLYPAVERAMGASGATATMSRDHVEVGRLVDELTAVHGAIDETLDASQRARLTQLLYGLHAVVALHFAKEEEIYVPLLDERLTVEEARSLLDEMERAAERHRHAE